MAIAYCVEGTSVHQYRTWSGYIEGIEITKIGWSWAKSPCRLVKLARSMSSLCAWIHLLSRWSWKKQLHCLSTLPVVHSTHQYIIMDFQTLGALVSKNLANPSTITTVTLNIQIFVTRVMRHVPLPLLPLEPLRRAEPQEKHSTSPKKISRQSTVVLLK